MEVVKSLARSLAEVVHFQNAKVSKGLAVNVCLVLKAVVEGFREKGAEGV